MQAGFRPPLRVAQNLVSLYGDRGRQWLAGLPDRLRTVSERWQLTLQPPFASASYCFVAPGLRSNGQEVAIKVGYPDPGLDREAEALRWFGGWGVVHLLDADRVMGALLLERCRPGTSLSEGLSEDEAITAAALVMAQLHRDPQPGHSFPNTADWAGGFQRLRQRFGGGSGPIPDLLLQRAERIYAEMALSGQAQVVLHGDLHHGNILAAERQPWLAIDPKGVIGPPEYEVGAFLRNPMPHILENPDLSRLLARRVDRFSELMSFRRERLIAWGGAQSVLAACWALDGDPGRGWEPWIALAQALLALS